MNVSQGWTLIGAMVGLVGLFGTLMFAMFADNRSTVKALVDGLGVRMDARFDVVDAGFKAVDARFKATEDRFDARFDTVDARFGALDAKIDNLARITDVRLTSVEGDMHLVKAYLLGQRSA